MIRRVFVRISQVFVVNPVRCIKGITDTFYREHISTLLPIICKLHPFPPPTFQTKTISLLQTLLQIFEIDCCSWAIVISHKSTPVFVSYKKSTQERNKSHSQQTAWTRNIGPMSSITQEITDTIFRPINAKCASY